MKRLTTKWAKKNKLSNLLLLEAIQDLKSGLSTADLGQHLFKVRVKREHSGKSSGYRTIILYKKDDKAIFIHGFGKNEKENMDKEELNYFKKLGQTFLKMDSEQLETVIKNQFLFNLEEE